MPNPAPCPLCRSSATFDPITADRFAWKCPRCGNYSIVGSAESVLRATPIQSPGAVSGWIRRQNSMGVIPNIRSDDVARLRALTKPPFRERVERYLLAAADKAGRLDARVKVGQEELIGVSYSDHVNELVVIIDYLRQEGLLTNDLTDTERVRPHDRSRQGRDCDDSDRVRHGGGPREIRCRGVAQPSRRQCHGR
jgi:hypothetical protein